MGLNDTPRANRIHIGLFGRRNAGKSSLINALTGQNLAIVSDTPGTTADPVFKSMELHPIGPVVFIDTAGFDDEGELGKLRVARTAEIIDRTDIAIVVIDGTTCAEDGLPFFSEDGLSFSSADGLPFSSAEKAQTLPADPKEPDPDQYWIHQLKERKIPVITVINKWDLLDDAQQAAALQAASDIAGGSATSNNDSSDSASASIPAGSSASGAPIPISTVTGEGIEALRQAIADAVPEDAMRERILGDLVDSGDLVLLVMPQDIQAPKGRLILPQVQTIRELLDRKCTVVSTTADGLDRALDAVSRNPDLIITDSQCFGMVYEKKPADTPLTSFSILLAASKGDILAFMEGAAALDAAALNAAALSHAAQGTDTSATQHPFHVLIAEACTHVPLNEDIGSVKIPRLLEKTFGESVDITNVRGNDFPSSEELKDYDLIIHCGACMFNRQHVMSRIAVARQAGVPITNYGIFLAWANGILDKVTL